MRHAQEPSKTDTTQITLCSSLRLNKPFLLFLVSLLTFTTLLTPANASRGGIERPSNPFTVGYTFKLSGIDQLCSGVLISSTVIATAAHCLVDINGNKSTDFLFTAPGVALDAPIYPTTRQPKVLKTFLPNGYVLTAANDKDDIAFIQLDIPLASKGFIRVATATELSSLIDKAVLNNFGYGAVYETGIKYSVYAREYLAEWQKPAALSNTLEIQSANSVACAGDSGGPITTTLPSGEIVLIGVMSGTVDVENSCGTAVNGLYKMRITLVNPYMDLVKSALITPTPSPTAQPTAQPVVKKYKITCLKGKVKKYVTGTKPKCPYGYRQKAKVLIK